MVFVSFFILSVFRILLNSVHGSLPKCCSNADLFSLLCGVVPTTFMAKSSAFPNDSLALTFMIKFSSIVSLPRALLGQLGCECSMLRILER